MQKYNAADRLKKQIILVIVLLPLFFIQVNAAVVVNETTSVADTYTVEKDGRVTITIKGADGGDASEIGGEGATVRGAFDVQEDDVIDYVVGEVGSLGTNNSAGGGGSTGVYINSVLVLVAGAGAGGDNSNNAEGLGGQASEDGADGYGTNNVGLGGTNGDGASSGGGAGGGGFNSAGGDGLNGSTGGEQATDIASFANGGVGSNNADGGRGFTGGGGGADGSYSGGGGGYSGGGGAGANGGAGGGGSYQNTGYVGHVSSSWTAGFDGEGSESDGFIVIDFVADTDGDGVLDDVDIDDDNDGILDADEGIIDVSSVFNLFGDATQISSTEIQLTSVSPGGQSGTAMVEKIMDLNNSFTITAEVFLGTNDGGADGLTFVLHNDPRGTTAIGDGEGSTLGAMANGSTGGIEHGLSFEFDTYQSSFGSDDPAEDHTQIRDTDFTFNDTSGRVSTVTNFPNFEDSTWHTFEISWDTATSTLSYSIDGTTSANMQIQDPDIANTYFNGASQIYFGFTAATGGLTNDQRVRNIVSSALNDSDSDGIPNSKDLDSDNDGIPDNVEAQMTSGFTLSSNPPTVRADGSNAAYAQTGLIPPDTDNDGLPDYLDSDADNDLVTDCQESYLLTINICPVDNSSPGNTVGVNGLVEWAEPTGGDNYDRPSGLILTPGLILLEDEISGDTEKAYREAACGPAETNLTAYQWKTISFPCETGTNGIEELLGASLGTYGDEDSWVVYEQTGNYKADGKSETRLMDAGDPVVPGNGYWIIADANKTAKITRPLSDISQTATVVPDGTNYPGVPVSGAAFSEVMPYDDLPDSDLNDPRILMIGNPFFKKFQLSDMYYQNAAMGTTDYVSTATLTSGTSPMEPTVYIKNSSDITTGNYTAIVPETPGFGDDIPTMQGFWIRLNAGNMETNKITYPFEK